MKKNLIKYHSYKAAYSRMNLAIKSGFYLEAITIQESIISDRLLSFAIKSQILDVNPEKLHTISFSKLIETTKPHLNNSCLYEDLDNFRRMRNNCIHGFVKSFPEKPTILVKDFFYQAKQTALTGKSLTRDIANWHKRIKRNGYKI